MAEDDNDQDAGEGEGQGKKGEEKSTSKKPILLFAAVVLLVMGGAGAAYFTGLFNFLLTQDPASAQEEEAPPVAAGTLYFLMPEIIVNLNVKDQRAVYLKLRVSLELESVKDHDRIGAAVPRLVDNFQAYLREQRPEDFKGSAGIFRLREELLLRAAIAAAPAKVNDLLLMEFLVQ